MMMNLSGDSKTNIDKILEEFRNAKMVENVIHCHNDHRHRDILRPDGLGRALGGGALAHLSHVVVVDLSQEDLQSLLVLVLELHGVSVVLV